MTNAKEPRSILVPNPSELQRKSEFEQMLFGVGTYAYTTHRIMVSQRSIVRHVDRQHNRA